VAAVQMVLLLKGWSWANAAESSLASRQPQTGSTSKVRRQGPTWPQGLLRAVAAKACQWLPPLGHLTPMALADLLGLLKARCRNGATLKVRLVPLLSMLRCIQYARSLGALCTVGHCQFVCL